MTNDSKLPNLVDCDLDRLRVKLYQTVLATVSAATPESKSQDLSSGSRTSIRP